MRPLIVFDLDGTLIDSKRDLAESANEMLATYGAAPLAEAEVAGMVGDGAMQLVQRALETAGVTTDVSVALDRFLAIYAGRLFEHTRPYPGLSEAVAAAAERASLAVLTNKPEGPSRTLLDGFGLSRFFPVGDWRRLRVSPEAGPLRAFPPDSAGWRHAECLPHGRGLDDGRRNRQERRRRPSVSPSTASATCAAHRAGRL